MATSIGQYTAVFLPGEPYWQRSLADHSPQSHRVRHDQSDPVCTYASLFFCLWQLCPSEGAQLLGLWRPWWQQMCRDTDCLCCRSCGPIRVFSRASCSWWSEDLFGQPFSIAPSIQALRGLPCWGPFLLFCASGTQRSPLAGVLLCRSACQALKGAP